MNEGLSGQRRILALSAVHLGCDFLHFHAKLLHKLILRKLYDHAGQPFVAAAALVALHDKVDQLLPLCWDARLLVLVEEHVTDHIPHHLCLFLSAQHQSVSNNHYLIYEYYMLALLEM